MQASLNIKDPEAHRLAQAIAQKTGEPMTRIVVDALRERLSRLEKQEDRASLKELMSIATRTSQLVRGSPQPHGDLLYDDDGIPK